MNFHEEKSATPKHLAAAPGLVKFDRWLKFVGASPTTGWRWRKLGWVKTLNICGRTFISENEIARFVRAAEAGQFARAHKVPAPRAA